MATSFATVAWAAWLYRMPAGYVCTWGADPRGAAAFASLWGFAPRPVADATFRAGFRACSALACLAYVGLVSSGLARAPARRRLVPVAAATGLVLALLGPPALSEDVIGYVGYARLAVVHHLNPYTATQQTLSALGDPTGPFLRWPIGSPYGPLWTAISMAAVAITPRASFWGALIALKLVGAVALLALAVGGSRLAERLSPGRGPLVFVALALNPFFLIEGIASGHNDVVMMAFVMWALVAAFEDRPARAFALVGVAAAVKFVPLLLAPWICVVALRASPSPRRARVVALSIVLPCAAPVLAFAPFWRGLETLAGLRARSAMGQAMSHGTAAHALVLLGATYVAISAWVLRGGTTRHVVVGWVLASFCVVAFASGVPFPWYLAWPWAAALVLVEGPTLAFAAVLLGFAVAKTLQYTN